MAPNMLCGCLPTRHFVHTVNGLGHTTHCEWFRSYNALKVLNFSTIRDDALKKKVLSFSTIRDDALKKANVFVVRQATLSLVQSCHDAATRRRNVFSALQTLLSLGQGCHVGEWAYASFPSSASQ